MASPSRGDVPLHTEAAGAAPPDAFGPFRVLHQVGAGTLGPVFRAFDPGHNRLVAIKLFRLDLPPDRMHQLVAQLERLIVVDLGHPGIAAPIATGTDGIVAYLAQDFVSIDSLDVVIRDHGTAPAADALRVAAQLAGALDFAAAVKVYHGAMHPRDVLLAQEETRLTGLGVATALEQVGVTPPIRPPYTAPERIAGTAWDRRADIFSLAALIHEMLWGRRVAGLGGQAAQSLTELPDGDLSALRTVFARALAEEPADRFDTALDFAAALKAAFAHVVIAPAAAVAVRKALEERTAPESAAREIEPIAPDEVVNLPTDDLRLPFSYRDFADDLELRTAERDRYDDVEVAPAIVAGVGAGVGEEAGEEVGEEVGAEIEAERGRNDERHKTEPLRSIAVAEPSEARPWSPLLDAYQADVPPARSSRAWLVAAALIAGLLGGFAGGYLVGARQHPAPAVAAEQTRAPQPAPPARDYTEGAVNSDTPAAPTGVRSATVPPSREASASARASADRPSLGDGGRSDRADQAVPANPVPSARPRSEQGRRVTARAVDPDPGRLLVRSTPADATVFVDGRERGRTPVTIANLARGTHFVRIARDGYTIENRRVFITARRPAESLEVMLERPGAASSDRSIARIPTPRTPATIGTTMGTLDVVSRPAGARVFVDGRLVGTTPVGMVQVADGEHLIRLEHDGYRRWASTIRVVSGERSRVTASLEQ
jgi:hypothetical protein